MKRKLNFDIRPLAAVVLGAALLPSVAVAQSQAGYVLVASGSVKAVGKDGMARDLSRRAPVYSGDRLLTARQSNAQVKFTDGAIVGLKPSTELRIDNYAYEEGGLQQAFMSLVKGGFRSVTGAIGKSSKADYKVSTPVATIGIRGTLYEADFDPEEGLDLAVWDGGIQACNDNGCMDLGADVNHRFGSVGPDGSFNPRNEQGGDEVVDSGEEDDGVLDDLESELVENAFRNNDPRIWEVDGRSADFPYIGFAAVAAYGGSPYGGGNPWGDETLLPLEHVRYTEGSSPYGGEGDWVASSSVFEPGTYLVNGYNCGSEPCYSALQVQSTTLGLDGTKAYWGSWYSYSQSITADPDVPGEDVVQVEGVFAFGDYASPALVAQLVGDVNFSLYDMRYIDEFGYASSSGGSGGMTVNIGTGEASGALSFDTSYGNSWQLVFEGSVSASNGFDLAILSDTVNSPPASGSTVFDGDVTSAVTGTIDAVFVGKTQVSGIIGGFDVTGGGWDVNGVFVMGRNIILEDVVQ